MVDKRFQQILDRLDAIEQQLKRLTDNSMTRQGFTEFLREVSEKPKTAEPNKPAPKK